MINKKQIELMILLSDNNIKANYQTAKRIYKSPNHFYKHAAELERWGFLRQIKEKDFKTWSLTLDGGFFTMYLKRIKQYCSPSN